MAAILYLALILLSALPAVSISSAKKKNGCPQRSWIIGACIITVAVLTVFTFRDDRLELALLPQKNQLVWYIIWGALMLTHWFFCISATAKDNAPASMILPLVLPCLLLCSVGLAQENWLLSGIMAVYAAAALFRKGADPA